MLSKLYTFWMRSHSKLSRKYTTTSSRLRKEWWSWHLQETGEYRDMGISHSLQWYMLQAFLLLGYWGRYFGYCHTWHSQENSGSTFKGDCQSRRNKKSTILKWHCVLYSCDIEYYTHVTLSTILMCHWVLYSCAIEYYAHVPLSTMLMCLWVPCYLLNRMLSIG